MLFLATSDGARLDVSPKGDAPGFVHVDGARTLLIPDWPEAECGTRTPLTSTSCGGLPSMSSVIMSTSAGR